MATPSGDGAVVLQLTEREVSSPVEEGVRGEVEGRCIAKKWEISKRERRDTGTMH